MDQTKNNLERIRAFDAEEGEWCTINGAHVLIKNGRIAGGAGGALNGQPFRGGSLKKMQSGYRGEHADRITQKLKEGRAEKTLERLHQRRESQVQRPASRLTKMQAGSKGSKFNENRENASVRKAVKSPLYGAVPAGLNVERAKTTLHYDPNRRYTVIKGRRGRRGRNDDPRRYNVLEGARPIATNGYGTIFEADHKHLTVPRYPLGPNEGTARLEPSKTELAARARSLKERRPDLFKAGRPARPASHSREAERGGSTSPQQSAPHATKLGRMQPGSTAVNAGKEAKRLDHNARVYHRTARRAREAYNAKMDKAIAEQEALRQKAIGKLNSNALGVRAYAESHSRAETPEQATHKAAQYIKLGNKYRDKYRGMKESAENKQNEIERKKNDYKMKSYENVSRRDQEADNAKERLARMRKLAKALKARSPGSFKG